MYSKLTLARKFLWYYVTASNGKGHGIHSPFIYRLVRNVLNDRRNFYAFQAIESVRKELLNDDKVLQVEDMGAGSANMHSAERTVSRIARHSLKSPPLARLLFRIVNYFQPQNIVELGTSLGLTTAYLAAANAGGRIYTIEGANAVANVAQQQFNRLSLSNVNLIIGNFDEVLPGLLKKIERVDLAFIDGNHRLEPTIRYFEMLLRYSHQETILIFDDIHWSGEMEAAWQNIQQHPQVTCTVDLFFLGMIFLRKDFKVKQHFIIRY